MTDNYAIMQTQVISYQSVSVPQWSTQFRMHATQPMQKDLVRVWKIWDRQGNIGKSEVHHENRAPKLFSMTHD